jgi:hypothetical protein
MSSAPRSAWMHFVPSDRFAARRDFKFSLANPGCFRCGKIASII